MSYFEDVVRWHRAIGHPVREYPTAYIELDDSIRLGADLVREEHQEMMGAYEQLDMEELADGAADLIWVICGLCARLGIDLDAVWQEVRRANFDKLGGPVREDGKQLKPEGWEPPNSETIRLLSRLLSDIR